MRDKTTHNPRADRDEAFMRMAENGDDKLSDWDVPNLSSVDQDEWEWDIESTTQNDE